MNPDDSLTSDVLKIAPRLARYMPIDRGRRACYYSGCNALFLPEVEDQFLKDFLLVSEKAHRAIDIGTNLGFARFLLNLEANAFYLLLLADPSLAHPLVRRLQMLDKISQTSIILDETYSAIVSYDQLIKAGFDRREIETLMSAVMKQYPSCKQALNLSKSILVKHGFSVLDSAFRSSAEIGIECLASVDGYENPTCIYGNPDEKLMFELASLNQSGKTSTMPANSGQHELTGINEHLAPREKDRVTIDLDRILGETKEMARDAYASRDVRRVSEEAFDKQLELVESMWKTLCDSEMHDLDTLYRVTADDHCPFIVTCALHLVEKEGEIRIYSETDQESRDAWLRNLCVTIVRDCAVASTIDHELPYDRTEYSPDFFMNGDSDAEGEVTLFYKVCWPRAGDRSTPRFDFREGSQSSGNGHYPLDVSRIPLCIVPELRKWRGRPTRFRTKLNHLKVVDSLEPVEGEESDTQKKSCFYGKTIAVP